MAAWRGYVALQLADRVGTSGADPGRIGEEIKEVASNIEHAPHAVDFSDHLAGPS
jgi:hypothetical protein